MGMVYLLSISLSGSVTRLSYTVVMNFESLMDHIASTWVCTPERYPELAVLNEEQRKNFRVKHALSHIGKSFGKVATVTESFDHDAKASPEADEALKVAATKMFVNSVKLAEEAGLSASELLKRAPEYIK
jgi:hypothetical protein